MADLSVVDELRDYLIDQGVVQAQDAAKSPTLPSVWISPLDGIPLPQGVENQTVTLRDTRLQAAATVEAWIEEAFIDVIIRSRSEPEGQFLHRAIRGLLIDQSDAAGMKRMWTMGAISPVEYSGEWRGEQPLPAPTDRDVTTYDRVASYRFGVRRKILAGLETYVP